MNEDLQNNNANIDLHTKKLISLNTVVPIELTDKRLDQVLSKLFSEYSRTTLQNWIKKGYVTVDNKILRPRDKVFTNQKIEVKAILESLDSEPWEPQNIPLDIVYEDVDILIINKPIGLVVHPGAGFQSNTLLNALIHHDPNLKLLPRAGIIHRLDKNTSGLLIIAKNLAARNKLVKDLQKHQISREYEAIVRGVMTAGGTINAPIGRNPRNRTLMAINESGKLAVTHYRIIKRFKEHTHIKVILETGRTHQIRVHLAHINYPIVGDPKYSGRMKLPQKATNELIQYLRNFKRQALHAKRLKLIHPTTLKEIDFEVPLPEDMQKLLQLLK